MSQKDVAFQLIQQQNYQEALEIILNLLQDDADDWNLNYPAGQCYKFTGDIEKAIGFLSHAAQVNIDEPEIFLALGIAHQINEDYEAAIDKLTIATKLDTSFFSAYNSLGLTYRKMNQLQDAIEWYSKASDCLLTSIESRICKPKSLCYKDVESDSDGKKGMVVLPYVFMKIEEELKSSPEYAMLQNNIGVCFMALGNFESARGAFIESINMTPDGFEYPLPIDALKEVEMYINGNDA
ncbi:MAG: tetratricopeptide repeat protein [Candidatus Thioglobus sp.]